MFFKPPADPAVREVLFTGAANQLAPAFLAKTGERLWDKAGDYLKEILEASRGGIEIAGHEDAVPYTLEINVEASKAVTLIFRNAATEVVLKKKFEDADFSRDMGEYDLHTQAYQAIIADQRASSSRVEQIDEEKTKLHTACAERLMARLGPEVRFGPDKKPNPLRPHLVARSLFALCTFAVHGRN